MGFAMPLNFQPERLDPTSLRTNLRAVDRHLTFDHYVRTFQPGDFVVDAVNATHALVNVGGNIRWPAVEMADATVGRASASWLKPSEWRSGKLAVTLWFTCGTGSTNAFVIGLRLDAIRAGEALNGTNLLNVNLTLAGPAAALTVIRTLPTFSTVSFGADDELFTLSVARIGTDAADVNVNPSLLLMAKVEHLPANAEGQ